MEAEGLPLSATTTGTKGSRNTILGMTTIDHIRKRHSRRRGSPPWAAVLFLRRRLRHRSKRESSISLVWMNQHQCQQTKRCQAWERLRLMVGAIVLPHGDKLSKSADDDEFSNFQSAQPVAAAAPAPAPAPISASRPNVFDLIGAPAAAAPIAAAPVPMQMGHRQNVPSLSSMPGFGAQAPAFAGMGQATMSPTPAQPMMPSQSPSVPFSMSKPMSPPVMSPAARPIGTPLVASSATPAKGGTSGFDDLWTMSLGSAGAKPATPGAGSKSIKDLEREKAQAAIWGSSGGASAATGASIWGTSASGSAGGASAAGAADDLLL